MLTKGQWISVRPFEFAQHLAGGAVIKPPKTRLHHGYGIAQVVDLFSDGAGGVQVEYQASVYGDVDVAPLSACVPLLTVAEVAALKGCSEVTVRRALRNGEFARARSVGVGQRKVWLLDAEEAKTWQVRPVGRPAGS